LSGGAEEVGELGGGQVPAKEVALCEADAVLEHVCRLGFGLYAFCNTVSLRVRAILRIYGMTWLVTPSVPMASVNDLSILRT
jgi:hypothetical protein